MNTDKRFWVGLAIFSIIIVLICFFPYWFTSRSFHNINFRETGQIGDTIGGIMGPFIAIAAAILTFLAFWVQYQANVQQRQQFLAQLKKQKSDDAIQEKVWKVERFENNYFELIRLHRDNVNALKYTKFNVNGPETSEGRKVFRIIFKEFYECYREVRRFSKSENPDDFYKPKYKERMLSVISSVNPKINLVELAQIDIAYSIVFFGASDEGEIVLRHRFLRKYKDEYFYRLLKYIRLKPKNENKSIYTKWELLQKMDMTERRIVLEQLYEYRLFQDTSQLLPASWIILTKQPFEKYYGGHQHRLGHYFRHLFQCYKYLNEQIILNDEEKYLYGKMLRAQLSTYEQFLLFINSISSLGMKWEFTPEVSDIAQMSSSEIEKHRKERKLITKYQLIKNLPGSHFFKIVYKKYYPNIRYEDDEWFSKSGNT